MGQRIRVLVVDDSALARQMLVEMLSSDPMIEVVGTAPDPLIARRKISTLAPDVVTLDIEMPQMDGITFLEKIMRLRPMPVVMVSSLVADGTDQAVKALELGAIDLVLKPSMDEGGTLMDLRDELIAKVKAASMARVRALPSHGPNSAPRRPVAGMAGRFCENTLIAIGASTGGVFALTEILAGLPADSPPIAIVQHMRPGFTKGFAARLDQRAPMKVVEARDGLRLGVGLAVIAPGDRQLEIVREGGGYVCRVLDAEPVNGHKPSVDVLFHSISKVAGRDAIGIILTGMGKDGAKGLLEMRRAGAATIGQDEATCIVYGMPRVAREIGAVEKELPLDDIAGEIIRHLARAAELEA